MKSPIVITGVVALATAALIYNIVSNDSSTLVNDDKSQLINTTQEKNSPVQNEAEVLAPTGLSKLVYESQSINAGVIGIDPETNIDDPHDNTFHVYLDGEVESGRQAWLEYDLYGAEDFTSVCRAINDEVAIGGAFIKLSQEWSAQSEKIDASRLHKGDNIIRFSIPGNNDFNYIVKNVRIRFDESVDMSRRIVLNQPLSKSYYNRYGYISGFVSGQGSENAKIYANGKQIRSNQAAFEGLVDQIASNSTDWKAVITAVFADGQVISDTARFCNPATCDFANEISTDIAYNETTVNAQLPVHMNVPGFELNGEPGSVINKVKMSVTALRSQDMALPRLSMVNVTGGSDGFRCLPHGNLFSKEVEVRIKYDTARIPKGYGPKDIRTFYYSEEQGDWIMLPYDTFDVATCEIISHTTHFTDFINGILKTPESPQTQAFTPTSMKDMKFADPIAHINMMSPPQANNSGTANMSFQIEVPSGRQGMQPQLSLNYSSDNGNGFLGVGWGMNIPSVSVDTRWGVPKYSSSVESESYLVNGEQIIELDDTTRLQLVHRDYFRPRSASTETYYSYRVEGSFNKTIRHGSSPATYWWEVIDSKGTRYLYGKYDASVSVDTSCVLRTPSGNIAQWGLAEVIDINGNNIRYYYTKYKQNNSSIPGYGGIDLYLESIQYTGYNNSDGKYGVEFIYDDGQRSDYTISGRYGLLQVTNRLLKWIKISYDNTFVRAYAISYTTGAYGKNLICAIGEMSDSSLVCSNEDFLSYTCEELYQMPIQQAKIHGFEYYQEMTQNFSDPDTIFSELDEPAVNILNNMIELPAMTSLGNSVSSGGGVSGSLNLGLGTKVTSKVNSIGGSISKESSSAHDLNVLIDLNGDNLPDRVYSSLGTIYYRKLSLRGDSLVYDANLVQVPGLPRLGTTYSSGKGWGLEGQIGPFAGSYGQSESNSYTSSYFEDMNADGFNDFVFLGRIYYNFPDASGNPSFTPQSNDEIQYIGGDTCRYLVCTGSVNDSVYTPVVKRDSTFIYNRDAVRIWIAPYSGTISLQSSIQLIEDTSFSRTQSRNVNGIKYAIQRNGNILDSSRIYEWDYTVHGFSTSISVTKGDRLYFRLNSVNERSYDNVVWDPRIKYTTIDSTSLDANGKSIAIFQPSQDMLLNNKQMFIAPYSGKVMLRGSMVSNALTDTLFFKVKKGTTIVNQSVFADNTAINYYLNDSLQVDEGDSIIFEAFTSSNVDWNGIVEDFKVFYYYADSITIDTNSVYSKIEVRPMVQYNIFQDAKQRSYPISLASGTYLFKPTFAYTGTVNDTILVTIKTAGNLVAKQKFHIVNNTISGANSFNFTLSTAATIYVDYFTDNNSTSNYISTAKFTLNNQTLKRGAGLYVQMPDSMWKFGNLYRGWGQFSYYDSNDTVTMHAIDESKLHLNELYQDTTLITFDTTGFSNPNTVLNALSLNGLNNHTKECFSMMYPDLDSMVWRDYAFESYVGKSVMSNTSTLDVFTDTIFDSPIIISNNPNVAVRTVLKEIYTDNESWSVGVGFTLGGDHNISYSHNYMTCKTLMNVLDLNGDRYPDFVGTNYAQYTTPQGGLYSNVSPLDFGTSNGEGHGNGYTYGVVLPIFVPSGLPEVGDNGIHNPSHVRSGRDKSQSGTYFAASSIETSVMMDVNGDGLPDRVRNSDGNVSLNMGYGYHSFEDWNVAQISEDKNDNLSYSYSSNPSQSLMEIIQKGWFNKAEFSWSGGVGLSLGVNNRTWGMIDMNNDGYPDLVHFDSGSNNLETYLNFGNGFSSSNSNWTDGKHLNQNANINANATISGSIGFPIWVVKVVFGIQLSSSGSFSHNRLAIIDMNNDGYPDIVSVNELTQNIEVQYNEAGKVNILKQVTTPVASKYYIDYTLSTSDQNMPSRKWDMTSLKIFDGFVGDGQDTTYQKFEYAGGYYDRFERTNNGYNSVKTMQYDHFGASGICYRSGTEYFHNDDYLLKGLKYYEVVKDSVDAKYVETFYHWNRLEIETGDIVPAGQETCFGPYYPGLSQEDKYFYEGQANWQIHTRKTYLYGPYGNIETYINYGDMADSTDRLRADITYSYDTTKHILGMVDQIDVLDYTSTLLRRKTGDYDTIGQLTAVGAFDGTQYAYTNIHYNNYGNITYVEYPENYDNDRMVYYYAYDTVVNTYVTEVKDYWDYTSNTEYDLKTGLPLMTRDISGNEIEFTYYADGKPKTVTGPNELAAGIPYTIKFEYWDEQNLGQYGRWARTRHYDTLNSGNEFVTVTFADGLGRAIQTKKKVTILGMDSLLVSGENTYDAYGRVILSSLPTTEALGQDSLLTNFAPSHFSSTQYDVLDRPLVQTAPDQTQVSFDYAFGVDAFGKTCFKTKITDPNSIQTTKYTDARGLNTSVTAPLNTITKFLYSPLGELLQSTDPENNVTTYSYDLLGRMTQRIHPDAGRTIYTFDLAGNVLTTQTENLYAVSENIQYYYDVNRVTNIKYPLNPEMDVYYEYGTDSSGNQSGRLIRMQDASGVQTFEYGKMGELIKNIHTFVVPAGEAYTFETRWEYDSWNRMKNITYPDGEVVSYYYNNGGQLTAMDGVKGAQSYGYIDSVLYDRYGSRQRIDYANGTYAEYSYDPLNQRLTSLKSYDNTSTLMQNIAYTYDDASNITAIENTAGYVNNELGGICVNYFIYDDLYRLTSSEGAFVSFNNSVLYQSLSMSYSASGNILSKNEYAQKEIGGGLQTVSYSNTYQYSNRPHNVTSAGSYYYQWDSNGNLISRGDGSAERYLCWDEENRLATVRDNGEMGVLSSYIYNAGGERIWKLTGNAYNMFINGQNVYGGVDFMKTLYSSPYMVLTDEEYTKHYYIEGERVCSKLGGGFALANIDPSTTPINFLVDNAEEVAINLWDMVKRGIDCTDFPSANVGVKNELVSAKNLNDEAETNRYFYHSDHLGSSSFITDATGTAIQHLQYLPYGELWINQQTGTFDSRYKFSAKELDDETGYSYFGARYYDSDLSVWLSVDPLSDKYPSTSGYMYCLGNPINLIDLNGMESDDWVERSDKDGKGNKTVVWDPDVTSANDPDLKTGDKYLGKEGYDLQYHYKPDGTKTPIIHGLNEFVIDGGQLSDHAKTMSNPLVKAIHQAQSDFINNPATQIVGGVLLGAMGLGMIKTIVWVYKNPSYPVRSQETIRLRYDPRVRQRGVEDPKSHNFPYSFDKIILQEKPINRPNGYRIYRLEGSLNNDEGVFEIGVTRDGIIDHRCFRSY